MAAFLTAATTAAAVSMAVHPSLSFAADSPAATIVYKSGKFPIGQAKSTSDPKAGTKKDVPFLRCVSNCKTDCQDPVWG
jgi:TATA-box binding protein (TBP) (component of TFIID and TFIIIB)